MTRDNAELRRLLYGALRGGTAVVLATVSEDGVPTTALNSWVVAKDETTIAFALDSRSSAYHNISNGRTGVGFELLADGLILAVRGHANIVRERLDSVPFPCALVHIRVDAVRDHTTDGLRFQGPRYAYADDKGHRGDVERTIFEELARDVAER